MDRNDQQAIDRLFEKLAAVENQGAPRDAEAERFIQDRIATQPGAPYYMAQTIVVQEQALHAAQARIEELERQAPPEGGSFLGGLFGGSQQPRRSGSVPSIGGRGLTGGGMAGGMPGRQAYRTPGGGGFLAGAAQTAMGVAGGVLLGSAIAGMFSGNEAMAGEAGAEDAAAGDGGGDDLGGGGGDMGGDFGDLGF